jgi:hypothetical protein
MQFLVLICHLHSGSTAVASMRPLLRGEKGGAVNAGEAEMEND